MVPTPSLDSLLQSVDAKLGVRTRKIRMPVPSVKSEYFVPGQPSIETRIVDVQPEQWSKLIGILLCNPSSKLGREEVIPHLDYFHNRSAHVVDFFCIGYRSSDESTHEDSSQEQKVATVAGVPWLFSAQEFNECRLELESQTKWQYSGESDLLLAVVRKSESTPAIIDYQDAIACNLEQMIRDEAITSARAFFEKVCQFGDKYEGKDPVWKLSDSFGLGVGGSVLLEAVLSLLPESARKGYKAAKHFAIRNISR